MTLLNNTDAAEAPKSSLEKELTLLRRSGERAVRKQQRLLRHVQNCADCQDPLTSLCDRATWFDQKLALEFELLGMQHQRLIPFDKAHFRDQDTSEITESDNDIAVHI